MNKITTLLGILTITLFSSNEVQELYAQSPCPPQSATATATVVDGFVVSATVTDNGCGYTYTPPIEFVGGGGSGAAATARVTNGEVVGITITDAGSNYTSTPFLYIGSPIVAQISLAQAVVPVFSGLSIGTNYQLQSSGDLINWNNQGPAFTATNSVMFYSQYFIESNSTQLYFRLQGAGVSNALPPTLPGMALVPGGAFTMGDTLDGESDAIPTNIYVSAFYMDTNLVSYSQWQSIYAYATNLGYGFDGGAAGKATNHPVQSMNWYDAVKWCNARSQQAGLTPIYYTDSGMTMVYSNGDVAPYVNWGANGYRLPTEAEWEKAARGGISGQRFPWGATIAENQANYEGDTSGYTYDLGPNGYNSLFDTGGTPYTSPVGAFAANGYGLYDMAGNVFGWCWDWYGATYGQPTSNNPTGPASGSDRILRGGSWASVALYERCANRLIATPGVGNAYIGFRCVKGF